MKKPQPNTNHLRNLLPPLMDQMQRVTNMRVYNYYLAKYTAICERLHDKFREDYPLNKK